VELIKEEKRQEVEEEIRTQVDELMRTELKNLKAVSWGRFSVFCADAVLAMILKPLRLGGFLSTFFFVY